MAFQNTIITTTTPATIITPIANYFNDLIWMIITNTSAIGTRVDIATSGGTTCSVWVAPTSTLQVFPPGPIPTVTAGVSWTATLGTAVTDIRIFVNYYSHQ